MNKILGLKSGTVKLVKYNPRWKEEFEKEKKVLFHLLKDFEVDIQHIGSTSIIGCVAKPIIDIAIGVKSLDYGKSLIPILTANGYYYDGKADYGIRYFLKKCNNDISTHFVHIEDTNTRIWQNHIIFRDYLNSHPEKTDEYSALKLELERKFKDNRKEYTNRKAPFITNVIDKALKEWNIKKVGKDYKF